MSFSSVVNKRQFSTNFSGNGAGCELFLSGLIFHTSEWNWVSIWSLNTFGLPLVNQ